MAYYWEDEDSEEEDFPDELYEDDEEILRRYGRLKFIRRILAIVAILLFVGVFVAPEIARQLPFMKAGPKTPDYLEYIGGFDDFARFDPGAVYYSITYDAHLNNELVESTIRTAAAEWEGTLNGLLDFTWAEDGEAVDLIIEIVEELSRPGICYLEFYGEHYRPRIELNASKLHDPNVLHIVIAHELGHALGIWGHSDHPGDLMFPTPVRKTPSKRDARTLRLIYEVD